MLHPKIANTHHNTITSCLISFPQLEPEYDAVSAHERKCKRPSNRHRTFEEQLQITLIHSNHVLCTHTELPYFSSNVVYTRIEMQRISDTPIYICMYVNLRSFARKRGNIKDSMEGLEWGDNYQNHFKDEFRVNNTHLTWICRQDYWFLCFLNLNFIAWG